MKRLLAIFCLTLLANVANAQAPGYKNLQILYADANYVKLTKVASGYTEKDKTKTHVLPYIWLAKGLYKISLSGNTDEAYKNAYKDAIKYLKKGLKYDLKKNDGATFQEPQHREFLDEFQMSLLEVIDNELGDGNMRKAYGWVVKYKSITVQQIGVSFMSGACKYTDDKTTARSLWQEANAGLDTLSAIDTWSEADRTMLKLGILYSASALKKSRQEDKARKLLGKAAQWFEEDEDWQERYDDIVN